MEVMRAAEVVISVLRESQQRISFSVDRPNLFVFRIAIKASAMRRECNPPRVWRPIRLSCGERSGGEATQGRLLRIPEFNRADDPLPRNASKHQCVIRRIVR